MTAVQRTSLNAVHRRLGARMTVFAGWEMPAHYAGPIREQMAVRTRAGIFDVSHMGELEIRGPTAEKTLQYLTCNDINRLSLSQCQYSALTTREGTFVDDLLVYRLASDSFLLCVNAANQEKDFQWIRENALRGTDVLFRSDDFSQLAVQGPKAVEILQPLTEMRLAGMKHYRFERGIFAGVDSIVSRTGYTGEDGFEIYCSPGDSERVWSRIMETGKPFGLEPAGLAARNILRLEARLMLYGNDIDETTTVLEADLGWICKFDKGGFFGRDALLRQRELGLKRILVGFEMADRAIARDRYPVEFNGRRVGTVTSGSPSPFLGKNIGLTYLPIEGKTVGTEFGVVIRGKTVKARVVPTPFYRRVESGITQTQ